MAAVGGLAIPFLVGVMFHSFGPVTGMSSISIFVLGILISLLIIKKEMPISDHIKRHLLP
jgi:fucose permease